MPVRTDVRILATISLDIERALADKKLHEDLYNRLSAFTLRVPSLSERKEEIPLLIDYFMQQLAKLYSLPPRTFTPEMVDACEAHIWRGNLRELKSYVKRFLVVGDEELALTELQRGEVGCDSDNPANSETRGEGQVSNGPGLKSLLQSVKGEAERTAIAAALDRTRWNRKAAAELLKVSYRTLLYKIEQYHMTPPEHPLAFLPSDGARGSRREG